MQILDSIKKMSVGAIVSWIAPLTLLAGALYFHFLYGHLCFSALPALSNAIGLMFLVVPAWMFLTVNWRRPVSIRALIWLTGFILIFSACDLPLYNFALLVLCFDGKVRKLRLGILGLVALLGLLVSFACLFVGPGGPEQDPFCHEASTGRYRVLTYHNDGGGATVAYTAFIESELPIAPGLVVKRCLRAIYGGRYEKVEVLDPKTIRFRECGRDPGDVEVITMKLDGLMF